MGKSNYKRKGWLREKVIDELKSAKEVAEICDVTTSTIHNWLRDFDIEVPDNKKYTNREWLEDQIRSELNSAKQVAEICDVTTRTIHHWLNNFNIEVPHGQTIVNNQKVCPRCNDWFDLSKFNKNKSRVTGLMFTCRDCRKKIDKEYYQENKQKIKENIKTVREENKKRYLKNRRERYQERKENNPSYVINKTISSQIRDHIKGRCETSTWTEYVNYNLSDLKEHLEAHFGNKMNWGNYGNYWHIDHMIPRYYFDFDSKESVGFRRCWGLENLQPMGASKNVRLGNKLPKDLKPREK